MAGPGQRSTKVTRVAVPGPVASSPPLTGADASYAWEITPAEADDRSAEAWARAVFEGAPPALRAFIVVGWRTVLLLRLGPRSSPGHVLGWTIEAAEDDRVTLAVESPLLSARAVVVVPAAGGPVSHTTLIRWRSRLGRAAWALAAPIHRLTVPYLLGHARRSDPKKPPA